MKKIIISIVIVFSVFSCSTIPKEKIIPYLLSVEAENSIYKSIKSENLNDVSFYIEHLSDNKFKIHLFNDGIKNRYFYSNRKLFINDRFYPLVFDMDYIFYLKMENDKPVITKFESEDEKKSFTIEMPDIQERISNKQLYAKSKISYTLDLSTFWIVDEKGNLIETNSK